MLEVGWRGRGTLISAPWMPPRAGQMEARWWFSYDGRADGGDGQPASDGAVAQGRG